MLSNWKDTLVCAFVAAALALPSAAQAIVDFDSDGIDDVWEELYGAQSLLPGGDDDEDGETNLEESLAGTNPFDSGSWLRICGFTGHLDSATVTWPTQEGKLYRVQLTSDLGGEFQDEGTTYPGTGGVVTAHFSDSQDTFTTGVISEEVWTDVPGDTIADLTGAAGYPGSPDAVHGLSRVEIPQNQNNDYGGRLRGFIQVPVTGVYTFSIASRGESELWLSLNEDPENRIRVAWVTGDHLLPKQWDIQANQRSFSLYLTAEHRCYFEVLHQHAEGLDHLSVGWEGPGIPADDPDPGPIQVIEGQYLCPWVDGTANAAAFLGGEHFFARVTVEDIDQDGDGISDWAEKQMAGDGNFSFADSVSTASGWSDAVTMSYALTGPGDSVEVVSVDAEAVENNAPDAEANPGSFRIVRKGGLQPLAVNFGFVAAPFPGESAESADFTITDGLGNPQGTTVLLPFGGVASEVMIHPVDDGVVEYPEQVQLQVFAAPAYSLGVANAASISIIDLRDLPENEILFSGAFSPEPSAGIPTVGNGFVSAKLNGPRDRAVFFNDFFNLTSPQSDSHVHKANAGPAPGPIVYKITNVPGEPASNPLIGQLGNYPWDIGPAGSFTAQQFIDSLFGQNGESKLYLNIHTNDNPIGEIWAFLNPVVASVDPPDPPSPPPPITQLFGEDLERDCWRFLNQATFGATQAEVDALVSAIEAERVTVPAYSRIDAFEDWIDAQVGIPQTFMVDYVMAATNQEWKLRGYYDQSRWTSGTASPLPAQWPSIDRSNPDPAQWVPTADYPVTDTQVVAATGSPNFLNNVVESVMRHALWTVMLNSEDQLRQRVGFALQQINVVSYKFPDFEHQQFGMTNYQDMLNYHAFGHYREVLDHVAWSPMMGKYLSSFQNQKAFDLDSDGNPDVHPDENLAREIMQLFSVGLFVLHLDGSLALSAINGLPIPTYDNDEITELARILTGQAFSKINPGVTTRPGAVPTAPWKTRSSSISWGKIPQHQFNYPMKMFGDFHDTGPKTILGGKVIDNTNILPDTDAVGVADISDALDWLAGIPGDGQPDFDMTHSHQSTPPFIAQRLIQRFVTSNPNRDYLYRTAKVFKDSEENLLETVKAILLDYEARELGAIDDRFGHKKSPLIAYFQVMRAFDAHSFLPIRDDGTFPDVAGDTVLPDPYPPDMFLENFGYPTAQANNFRLNSRFRALKNMENFLSMEPMRQTTVFNFYLPDYSPPGPVAGAGLVAPEMHILHAGTAIHNINEFGLIFQYGVRAMDEFGMKPENQALALGLSEQDSSKHSHLHIDRQFWADQLYPSAPLDPDPVVDERMRDTALLDALDMILTAGRFKDVHPDDPSDDNIDPDPMDPEVGPPGPNPRESILNYLGESYTVDEPFDKFRHGAYLMTTTPEFWIRK